MTEATRRYITVIANGDDGNVERRYTINPDDLGRKLDVLRKWTADAYAATYGQRPRSVNVSDWPLIIVEGRTVPSQAVHGVEGATFAFPAAEPGVS